MLLPWIGVSQSSLDAHVLDFKPSVHYMYEGRQNVGTGLAIPCTKRSCMIESILVIDKRIGNSKIDDKSTLAGIINLGQSVCNLHYTATILCQTEIRLLFP